MNRNDFNKLYSEFSEKNYQSLIKKQNKSIDEFVKEHYAKILIGSIALYKSLDIGENQDILKNAKYKTIEESIGKQTKQLFSGLNKDLTKVLSDTVDNSLKFTTELNRFVFKGKQRKVDKGKVKRGVLGYKNMGRTYTERIFRLVNDLDYQINNIVLNGVQNGISPKIIAKEIEKKIGISANRAMTTARTESARCYSQTKIYEMQENENSDKIIIIATLDDKTSQICQEKDGKILDVATATMDDLPPFHPNCRTDFTDYVPPESETRLNNMTKEKIPFTDYKQFERDYL